MSLSFCKSFKGSWLPTGVSPNSLARYTRIFMPVHCIPLHFHSLLLNHKLHTPKCSTYTFQDWQTLPRAFLYALASVLNDLNSLHLVIFYSSFRTQLPCHTLCEVVKSVCVCVFPASLLLGKSLALHTGASAFQGEPLLLEMCFPAEAGGEAREGGQDQSRL